VQLYDHAIRAVGRVTHGQAAPLYQLPRSRMSLLLAHSLHYYNKLPSAPTLPCTTVSQLDKPVLTALRTVWTRE